MPTPGASNNGLPSRTTFLPDGPQTRHFCFGSAMAKTLAVRLPDLIRAAVPYLRTREAPSRPSSVVP